MLLKANTLLHPQDFYLPIRLNISKTGIILGYPPNHGIEYEQRHARTRPHENNDEQMNAIEELIQNGLKIQAIKKWRELMQDFL